ncbi:hypothetical protein BDQ12DRAFT_665740 [Crucibulum laeve]|uniref:Uncharacterized protein n=1 Tax=Crucibulum laeve TaxID=68775 RepID=A0A5C3M2C8_9AGAR|nr:hypothetical protein BDQ12DRAFT_665740 [Crucibulum laeve]
MPHKRAKRTVRLQQQNQRGSDLAPTKDSLANEAIPKSASRILNASKIREEWKDKKRKFEDDGQGGQGKRRKVEGAEAMQSKRKGKEKEMVSRLTIKPGESMQHFNRRVEDDMRPLVKSAVQTSNLVTRNTARAEMEARKAKKAKGKPTSEAKQNDTPEPSPPPLVVDKHAHKAKEFQKSSTSAPRRLNDIAQAPPEIKKVPRGADKSMFGKRDVLSIAQKSMMEQEREKVVARYRQLKANRRIAGEGGDERDRNGSDEE